MEVLTICIPIVAAILGISYPLLVQIIDRIEEKYASTTLVDLWNKEKIVRSFKNSLKYVVIIILIWICLSAVIWFVDLSKIKNWSYIILLLKYSRAYFIAASTSYLVYLFFILIDKCTVYSSWEKLTTYMINKGKTENDDIYFRTLKDILYESIRKNKDIVTETIIDYVVQEFARFRETIESEGNENLGVEYPNEYYVFNLELITLLANPYNPKYQYIERLVIGGELLLGSFYKHFSISERTYRYLWKNITTAIKYNFSWISTWWSYADTYIDTSLSVISPEYPEDFSSEIAINQNEINKRNDERILFLNFHYALGGYLIYQERYNDIRSIFNYTSGWPPEYNLLPNSISQVIEIFFRFYDTHEILWNSIANKYPYLDLYGQKAHFEVQRYILQYCCLLFIRLYVADGSYYLDPLAIDKLPVTQKERRQMFENLHALRDGVNVLLDKRKIMEDTGLGYISEEWFSQNGKQNPNQIFDNIIKIVHDDYEKTRTESVLDEVRISKYFESTNQIISDTLSKYEGMMNNVLINASYTLIEINGDRGLLDKDNFVENADRKSVNYDSFWAEHVSFKINRQFIDMFYFLKSTKYLLNPEDVFSAIDKLELASSEHIIVFIGYIDYYINSLKIKGLDKSNYKGIPLVNYANYMKHSFNNSIFILRKEDLPNILYKPQENEEIDKYQLHLINDDYKIYASVVNLNANDKLREEWQLISRREPEELKKSVVIYLGLNIELRWKENIKMVQIEINTRQNRSGLANSINEVRAFEKI